MSRARLPQFLVIGAMKCGTTSLHQDLMQHPDVALTEKETSLLCASSDTERIAALYDRAFRDRSGERLRGEVTTEYTMLPDIGGIPARAHQLLGPDLKLIYLVRDPIERAISHHYHMYSLPPSQRWPADFDYCLPTYPSILNYSRYAMQIEPWWTLFGEEHVHMVCFHRYVQERRATLERIFEFLGLSTEPARTMQLEHHNRSDGKPISTDGWERLRNSNFYRRYLRGWLSPEFRRTWIRRLLPAAPPKPAPPSLEALAWMRNELSDDRARLRRLLGAEAPEWCSRDGVRLWSAMA